MIFYNSSEIASSCFALLAMTEKLNVYSLIQTLHAHNDGTVDVNKMCTMMEVVIARRPKADVAILTLYQQIG